MNEARAQVSLNQVSLSDKSNTETKAFITGNQMLLWSFGRRNDTVSTLLATASVYDRVITAADLYVAVKKIMARHSILRTTYFLKDDEIRQVVHDSIEPIIHHYDLRNQDQQYDPSTLLDDKKNEAFDFISGPLFRHFLIQLSDQETILFTQMNHFIADMGSLAYFDYEIELVLNGKALEANPSQSMDLCQWEEAYYSDEKLDEMSDLWSPRLKTDIGERELPFAKDGFTGDMSAFRLDHIESSPKIKEKLHAYAKRSKQAIPNIVIAAFGSALAKLLDQNQVTISTCYANRVNKRTRNVIGNFYSLLPIPVKTNHADLSGIIDQVTQNINKAFFEDAIPTQYYPYVAGSFPKYMVNYFKSDTFTTLFKYGMEGEPGPVPVFDLVLNVVDSADWIGFLVQYSSERFDPEDIADLSKKIMIEIETLIA
jgi:hypothetical protein